MSDQSDTSAIALAVSNKHWCMIAEHVAHMSMNVLTDMITALVRPGQEVCEEAADPSEVQSNRQISCHPWCQCPRCRFAIYEWSPNLHATRIFITTVHSELRGGHRHPMTRPGWPRLSHTGCGDTKRLSHDHEAHRTLSVAPTSPAPKPLFVKPCTVVQVTAHN